MMLWWVNSGITCTSVTCCCEFHISHNGHVLISNYSGTRELPAPPSETLLDYRHGNEQDSMVETNVTGKYERQSRKERSDDSKVNQHERRGVNEVESSKLRATNDGGRFVLRTISVDRAMQEQLL